MNTYRAAVSTLAMMIILLGVGCQSGAPAPSQEESDAGLTVNYDVPLPTQDFTDSTVAEMMKKIIPSKDSGEVEMRSKHVEGITFRYRGELADVSGGTASGVVMMDWKMGQYMLHARFEGLPLTSGGDFYEGWVVRKEPFDYISTGRLVDVRGQIVNTYLSDSDYVDYDFYVLTLEPDDGDPAPAEHILEGAIELVR